METRKYIFFFSEHHLMEKWLAAINISRKTAQERILSITGTVKNILRIIAMFDNDRTHLEEEITMQFNDRLCDGE